MNRPPDVVIEIAVLSALIVACLFALGMICGIVLDRWMSP